MHEGTNQNNILNCFHRNCAIFERGAIFCAINVCKIVDIVKNDEASLRLVLEAVAT